MACGQLSRSFFKWRIGLLLAVFGPFFLSIGVAGQYEGVTIQDVQVTCLAAPELANHLRSQIPIQIGEPFSEAAIRASIRSLYALRQFGQITVEAERVAGGVRLSFCPTQFETISKIQISGNRALSTLAILRALTLKVSAQIAGNSLADAKQQILELYRLAGYHQVQVEVRTIPDPGTGKVIVIATVQEGAPSKLQQVSFEGQTIFSEAELQKISQLRAGLVFSMDTLEKGLQYIKDAYAKHGYFDVKVLDQDMTYNFETGQADLKITLDEGPPTKIRFTGNAHLKQKTLAQQIDLFSLKTLKEDAFAAAAERVAEYYRAAGYPFVAVTYAQTFEGDAPIVTFAVEEGAQVYVARVTFEGNQVVKTKQLRKLMFTRTKGLWRKGLYQQNVFDEDLLAIQSFYQERGYLQADVTSVSREFSKDRRSVVLHVSITEGIQTRVEKIAILGETDEEILHAIRESLTFKEQDPLNLNQVRQSVDSIKDVYANHGYIQAVVDVVPEITTDNRLVTITLNLKRGQQFFIGKMTTAGVVRTKDAFVLRELEVQEGDVFNRQKIRESVRRLLQIGLYDGVTIDRLDPKNNDPIQDIVIQVEESKSAKTLQFGIGYSTEDKFKGFTEYGNNNVLNFGGRGSVRLELSEERPRLTLQYLQPHFGIRHNYLVATIFDDIQKDNDSFEIERRGGRIGLRYEIGNMFSAWAGCFFENENPGNVAADAVLSKLDTTDNLNLGGVTAQITADTRDDVLAPKNGTNSFLAIRAALNAAGADTEFYEAKAQSSWFLNLFDNVVLATSLRAQWIDPLGAAAGIPIYERYFVGGDISQPTSVRGFKKHEIGPQGADGHRIGGNRMFTLNAELRFPLYGALGGVMFYDSGANWLDRDGFQNEDFRDSVGAGLRVATPVGPLRLDYGWKVDRAAGESAGEYHLTIGSAF